MRALILVAIFSTTALAGDTWTTTKWIGKSCQICVHGDNFKVCKYHKKCPVKQERKQ